MAQELKTVRLRIPARPSDNYGKVDIHRVLESALTSDVGNPTGEQELMTLVIAR